MTQFDYRRVQLGFHIGWAESEYRKTTHDLIFRTRATSTRPQAHATRACQPMRIPNTADKPRRLNTPLAEKICGQSRTRNVGDHMPAENDPTPPKDGRMPRDGVLPPTWTLFVSVSLQKTARNERLIMK